MSRASASPMSVSAGWPGPPCWSPRSRWRSRGCCWVGMGRWPSPSPLPISRSSSPRAGCPALQQVLGELAGRPLSAEAPGAADYLAYARALRQAYVERLAQAGAGGEQPGPAGNPRASSTTHLSVVDRDGMMVALTQTLLSRFGAKVLLPETGVLMNNGIMWFDPRPNHPNSIAPGKRPLANMCPVTVSRPDAGTQRPWLALGASGGRSIIPAVGQIPPFLILYEA